jgi:hypothetical protein
MVLFDANLHLLVSRNEISAAIFLGKIGNIHDVGCSAGKTWLGVVARWSLFAAEEGQYKSWACKPGGSSQVFAQIITCTLGR